MSPGEVTWQQAEYWRRRHQAAELETLGNADMLAAVQQARAVMAAADAITGKTTLQRLREGKNARRA